jgi:very-short-patch-repair endonuclease
VDDLLSQQARAAHGLVAASLLGERPAREAAKRRLVIVQPRVYAAVTQPLTADQQVAAVRSSAQGSYAFVGWTALWLYGLADVPAPVQVGVPHSTRLRARPPVEVRRVAPAVLEGSRTVRGSRVVALEVAVVQACARGDRPALALVEQVLRDRTTTVPRLRARCRRGVAGSAAVRRAVDELAGTSLDAAVRRLHDALEVRGVRGLRSEVRFVSAAGASAYADLLDEASATVVEVDGFLSHTDRARFRSDRRRDRWLHAEHGMLTVRIDAGETLDDLAAVADEVAALVLARRAQRVRAS